jgi:hypothetical protein
VGFDVTRHLRLLVGKGYVAPVFGAKRKVRGYRLSAIWPPEPSFFACGPVGFTYFAVRWFKFYLLECMEKAMGQVETKAGMLQLGRDLLEPGTKRFTTHDDFQHSSDAIPHADGNFTDQNGKTWAADIDLINMQVDVSKMTAV